MAHSKRVLQIALSQGWLSAARYTNLRDVRTVPRVGFIDIDWQNYNFPRHLQVVKDIRPIMTVARDIECFSDLDRILDQAEQLQLYCDLVVVVPKDPGLEEDLGSLIPPRFLLGYSVPSRYGLTRISPAAFRRPVHLLGGRPDVQRRVADLMPVFSIDGNRFTLDAAFGDYFDGCRFVPHPEGGYDRCIEDSIRNINSLWESYVSETGQRLTSTI